MEIAQEEIAVSTSGLDPRAEALKQAGLTPDQVPGHVAIIMDGNGRWAQQQGQPRVEGHRKGADTVQMVVEQSAKLGVQTLTLYCLSVENWKRPSDEVATLMDLLHEFLVQERKHLVEHDIRLKVIGRRQGLPTHVLEQIDDSLELSANHKGLTVCLAINYGARQEILDAVKQYAQDVALGTQSADDLDEDLFSQYLYTHGLPDPDLVIRTAGEQRISNFLLWQISYAEIYISPVCWPEFGVDDYNLALRAYAQRDRKFGGLSNTPVDGLVYQHQPEEESSDEPSKTSANGSDEAL